MRLLPELDDVVNAGVARLRVGAVGAAVASVLVRLVAQALDTPASALLALAGNSGNAMDAGRLVYLLGRDTGGEGDEEERDDVGNLHVVLRCSSSGENPYL